MMSSMKSVVIGFVLGCLLPLQACGTTYRAESIEAWVVDAETAQPIEGLVVTANWELEEGTVGGNRPAGQIMVMETVTDNKGRFYFSAWGPKSTPLTFPVPLTSEPHLVNRDPHLLFFKSGYKWLGLENSFSADYNKSSLRKSDWNGKIIKMARFVGDGKEYAWNLTQLSNSMGYAFRAENCEWKQTPRILALLFSEADALHGRGVYIGSIRDAMSLPKQEKCGSALEFFKDYRK